MEFDLHMALVILAAAAATFATRIGGYILITRMKSIPPRVEAALNAVPAAVLTTLVAPAFFTGGWESKLALIVALFIGLRFSHTWMLVAAWIVVMSWRHTIGA
ncbi:AzlD family protein [Rhizobium hidalgonense]|uniref:AzlD family protein n=1 Tax=Rhizobium hidalgonense TaxID=1538159 RepID=A0A2A6KFQ3_9HYPH|nr:AzlD family protein [Rhizobium hidalgonense]EJC75697.1 putative membrane protein [Rhizobium leguminosarum bv. trifolii WSM2012]EJC76975.1 putative membrane protein [Rhizobium leguminosarum bv. trifolii WSM2012]MDR9772524.1 AzlD family protein [Rhizobium hidalgonense]MDR9804780.1 AzlD family protein [Rhizobium hidalgonense]MDR9811300.1 AzlD family protein [Rhizobium hidalgonense]